MSMLLPVHSAAHIHEGITEYLTTSFSLADKTLAEQLAKFLTDPDVGMFRGPYVRTRLPYATATDWEGVLSWLPDWFVPYKHQADAFRRLCSQHNGKPRRPEPTLVVTGTGSGKTESFLYPILDHCVRNQGEGIKALILYPMNALANDQAKRLASLIHEDPRLASITAGLYTGEASQTKSTRMTEDSLITDRNSMRENPPDILLTNYKMLDQLLLRAQDRKLWEKSAQSLQYLVLDEFHTYDGAQGTDVALLLRRLGLMLKRFQPEDWLTEEARKRVLGNVTSVATSATLGSKDKPDAILDFAFTVFGERFQQESVVTETALTLSEWQQLIAEQFGKAEYVPETFDISTLIPLINTEVAEQLDTSHKDYAQVVHSVFCKHAFKCDENDIQAAISLTAQHPAFTKVLENAHSSAIPFQYRSESNPDTLLERVFDQSVLRKQRSAAVEFLSHVLSELSYLRAEYGRTHGWKAKQLPGVELHMWVRELSRIDRSLNPPEEGFGFRWADDGPQEEGQTQDTAWLPACYCRNCGRSGWMVSMQPGGDAPIISGPKIRKNSIFARESQRPLLDTTFEIDAKASDQSQVMWFNIDTPSLSRAEPSEQAKNLGRAIPVLTYAGQDQEKLAVEQVCPSCGESNAIGYLGASVSTLLSVALSNFFGQSDLDEAEKKTLVFADSVQDAAHRSGFVQYRARTFALRTFIRNAVSEKETTLAEIPQRLVELAGDRLRSRFELLPPDLTDNPNFENFWRSNSASSETEKTLSSVISRLGIDATLEFGHRAILARSLTSTGSLTVKVEAEELSLHDAADAAVLGIQLPLAAETSLGVWARSILEQIRLHGGVYHHWFEQYLLDDCNSYHLNKRESRVKGIPSFPRGGAPKFPIVIGRRSLNHRVDDGAMRIGPNSFYAHLTARILGISRHDAAIAVMHLLNEFTHRGVLQSKTTNSGNTVYSIVPDHVIIRAEKDPHTLECDVCHATLNVDRSVREVLGDTCCHTTGCEGKLREISLKPNYYQRLYNSTEPRTVVAKEHTSLLKNEERLALESQFKSKGTTAANAPNVLVATPTLEMGIDIGDLSTVVLSSMPRTVASYVQRVGRAGRLTGNSLILALARGRGKALPQLSNPLSMIAGSVQPPVAFLSAEEILHRQFLAFVIEQLALDEQVPTLHTSKHVYQVSPHRKSLTQVIETAISAGIEPLLDIFCETLRPHVDDEVLQELRTWSASETPGHSLTYDLHRASESWATERNALTKRVDELEKRHVKLSQQAVASSTDDDIRAQQRSTRASLNHTREQLSTVVDGEPWIAAMERYGLLPNYTLLDDSVELNLNITRQQPGTAEFETERREYTRGVSKALFELAPGSTFYAQGIAAKIDSVEIGEHGSNIEQWQFCPSCSYSVKVNTDDHESPRPAFCPVCGDAHFADRNQIISVLPLQKASAQVEHSRSSINDSLDERSRVQYHSTFSAVVEPQGFGKSWYLSTGFGVQHLRRVSLHWLNLGKGAGERRIFGGRELEVPLFQVCKHCGHIDSEAGSNRWQDHLPWCDYRNKSEEDTVSFALGRTLTTQGIFLLLPKLLTVADSLTLPSLIAALKLGFKEVLGGDPDHLDVTRVIFGQPNSESGNNADPVEGLLLHDNVPGGTGYLSQFAEPEKVRELLEKSWQRLRSCKCTNDGLLCCENCLLPYAAYNSLDKTSRAAAEAALYKLLVNDLHPKPNIHVPSVAWDIEATPPKIDQRSHLEAMFFHELRTSLEKQDVKLKESVRGSATEWEFTFPGSKHTWRMQEQKNLHITIPDFYFSTDDQKIPDLALYLDGATYHISEEHERLHGDVEKRNTLFERNIQPWSLTWADIQEHSKQRELPTVTEPRWFHSQLQAQLAAQLNLERTKINLITQDPMTQFLAWLKDPNPTTWDKISHAAAVHVAMNSPEQVDEQIRSTGLGPISGTYSGKDSRAELLFDTSRGIDQVMWNEFLALSNLYYARGAFVTVHTDVTASALIEDVIAKPDVVADKQSISQDWQEIRNEFEDEPEVLECILSLALEKVRVPDSYGEELSSIASVAVWEGPKIAFVFERDKELEAPLLADAWTIISPEDFQPDQLPEAFAALKEST
ncbi:DEAD/DEAH box helicase [Corynebacterium freiburgense]|uniref:DEAD/DEAH box helicase n=1 Tax=Corynebacterium freiburgense TaxID=556548 RepID=UPI0004005367|nr:DEAD/DEAH box helicase [Corynebacterium freiburgense]WJZ03245.1 putative ATP-dependent helicase Lhr [Corynebacterium freiburgense]